MTLVHAPAWRYLIRGGRPDAVSRRPGVCGRGAWQVVLGAESSYLDLVIVVGAVDAVDDGTSGQVGPSMTGVDEPWTDRGTTGRGC